MRALTFALAIFLLMSLGLAPASRADELEVYGRVNVSFQDSDEASGRQTELRDNASRLGVRGEFPLGSGLTAIYQLEFGVNIDADIGEDTVTHRNQFVGLEGVFGKVMAGRHDTALKEAQGDFDLFDDLEGDLAGVFNGANRLADPWRNGLPASLYEDWYDTSWSAGLDRKFGEHTRLFTFITQGEPGGTPSRNRYVAIGLEHDF